MLKRRPLTKEDINNMFDNDSKIILEELLNKEIISTVKIC